ncbi:MAG TPA: hypothetical protein VFV87_22100 [Pirellulaceae bacterium]|nr:hypothetical protein [Pirellulaceae bacterium]
MASRPKLSPEPHRASLLRHRKRAYYARLPRPSLRLAAFALPGVNRFGLHCRRADSWLAGADISLKRRAR